MFEQQLFISSLPVSLKSRHFKNKTFFISMSSFQFSNSLKNCWVTWRPTSRVSQRPSLGYPRWPCGCKCQRGTSSADWPTEGLTSPPRTSHRPHSRCRCRADQSPHTRRAHWLDRGPPPSPHRHVADVLPLNNVYSTVRLVLLALHPRPISGLRRTSAVLLDFDFEKTGPVAAGRERANQSALVLWQNRNSFLLHWDSELTPLTWGLSTDLSCSVCTAGSNLCV